ncbi:hypothetical protein EVAR_90416_1 [Eumeta japonica]|uniref:Uncharacterized protein n=1 Tax=Eumeta variegata TaxID=151549 RepID=A0A4C1YBC2_EUMVA|nr:hypothetical protein EVAR_90416_1 [Eumeta japonica]
MAGVRVVLTSPLSRPRWIDADRDPLTAVRLTLHERIKGTRASERSWHEDCIGVAFSIAHMRSWMRNLEPERKAYGTDQRGSLTTFRHPNKPVPPPAYGAKVQGLRSAATLSLCGLRKTVKQCRNRDLFLRKRPAFGRSPVVKWKFHSIEPSADIVQFTYRSVGGTIAKNTALGQKVTGFDRGYATDAAFLKINSTHLHEIRPHSLSTNSVRRREFELTSALTCRFSK